jgi:tetratricopeptide (TPR) repeat protein
MWALEFVKPADPSRLKIFAIGLAVVLSCANLTAQRGTTGGTGMNVGSHTIEVHLTDQNGRPLSVALRVQIFSESGNRLAEAFSNREQGVADFEGFTSGSFMLSISGPDVETVTQNFEIYATEATHREFIRVQMKNTAPPGSPASPGSDPTVSAQDLSVPDKARDEFEKGMDAYARGDDRDAQDALELAVAIYPGYVRAHNNLGVLYLKAGQKIKAFVEFSKAVELDPKFAPGYVNQARVSISDGNFAEAEPALKKALEADPAALNAMKLLCETEFARNEYPQFLETARHVHQLTREPQYSDLHLVSAQILVNQGKKEEAAAEYQLFVEENPNDPRIPKVQSLIARLSK